MAIDVNKNSSPSSAESKNGETYEPTQPLATDGSNLAGSTPPTPSSPGIAGLLKFK